jgi:TolA-binding protein
MLEKVKGYPYPERIQFTIAECLDKSGAVAEALKAYQAVADAAPTSTKAIEARYRMGALYEKQKDVKQAVALYEQAANASGGEAAAQASFRLGELLEEGGEHDKAARSFMRIAILFLHETLSPEALWRAGGAFERAGKPDQARKAYGEIVSDYPKSPHLDEAKAALERIGKS